MSSELAMLCLLGAGIVAGIFAYRLPLSGKVALGLSAVPALGVACSVLWC